MKSVSILKQKQTNKKNKKQVQNVPPLPMLASFQQPHNGLLAPHTA